jgi:mRNA interferase MazF
MEVEFGGIYLYEPPRPKNDPNAPPSQPRLESEQSALLVSSGSEQAGLRPYIIVSRDIVNKGKKTAVGVSMSSHTEKANAYRIMLPVSEIIRDVNSTYQFRDSVALCDHVRVLDLDQIKRRIGKLSATAIASVGIGLSFVFDLR